MMRFAIPAIAGLLAFAAPASAQGVSGDWSRGSLPSGAASIETPCAAGNEQTVVQGDAEGVRCVDGPFEVGIVLTDGASFANGAFGDDPFKGVQDALRQDSTDTNFNDLTILGRNATRWHGQSSFGFGAMAVVEMSDTQMLLFMIIPLTDDADPAQLPNVLDRALQSLEIEEGSVS